MKTMKILLFAGMIGIIMLVFTGCYTVVMVPRKAVVEYDDTEAEEPDRTVTVEDDRDVRVYHIYDYDDWWADSYLFDPFWTSPHWWAYSYGWHPFDRSWWYGSYAYPWYSPWGYQSGLWVGLSRGYYYWPPYYTHDPFMTYYGGGDYGSSPADKRRPFDRPGERIRTDYTSGSGTGMRSGSVDAGLAKPSAGSSSGSSRRERRSSSDDAGSVQPVPKSSESGQSASPPSSNSPRRTRRSEPVREKVSTPKGSSTQQGSESGSSQSKDSDRRTERSSSSSSYSGSSHSGSSGSSHSGSSSSHSGSSGSSGGNSGSSGGSGRRDRR